MDVLFMDLDSMAGVVAYKHTGEPVMTVTAAVDRITIKNPIERLYDLEILGQVTFATGRSSMEISLQVSKARQDGGEARPEDVFITCEFTTVSLDSVTKKPIAMPSLEVEAPEKIALFEPGERNYKAKKAWPETALKVTPPNAEESELIHSIWLQERGFRDDYNARRKPANVICMDETKLQSAQIMQPQYRNRYQFMIFGGYLLKQSFELAFTCAAAFSHSRPRFLGLDPSTFENPVPVGSVLYLSAIVAYTDKPPARRQPTAHDQGECGNKVTRVQVRVDSKVRDVEHGSMKPTGQFNYTFLVDKDIDVMHRMYSKFMTWLDARRRAQLADERLNSGIVN